MFQGASEVSDVQTAPCDWPIFEIKEGPRPIGPLPIEDQESVAGEAEPRGPHAVQADGVHDASAISGLSRVAACAGHELGRPVAKEGEARDVSTAIARKWYSTAEVAEMLGYGLTKTKFLVLSGQIRSIKDGAYRRILPEWVDEYIHRVVEGQAG